MTDEQYNSLILKLDTIHNDNLIIIDSANTVTQQVYNIHDRYDKQCTYTDNQGAMTIFLMFIIAGTLIWRLFDWREH